MKTKKVKKKKLNVARTLVFILFIYIIVCVCIHVYQEPVKHYEISGNNFVKDVEILQYAKLDNYPSFVSISSNSVKKKLESHPLILKANVKYAWNYTLKIEIEENKPILIEKQTNQICLADSTKIDYDDTYVGLPMLLNQTPEKNLKILTENLSKVDVGILSLISEIEYYPSYNQEHQVIDENRFLLSMVDGNLVFITAKNAQYLNDYIDVVATDVITGNGTLYLDGNQGKYPFGLFETTTTTTKKAKKG